MDEANPWTRLTRTVVYDNPWVSLYHDEVRRPDGRPGIYGVVHYKSQAVGVVALDSQDRVLLVGQYRYVTDAYSWELPQGGSEPGEDEIESAQRELLEETGCTASQWERIARVHLSNSTSDETAVCYLARGIEHGAPTPEGTEVLTTRWVAFEHAIAMAEQHEISDALSVLALYRVALLRMTRGLDHARS
jgi:8-oxo-dGTP pyrophosphatase MutT (NUDIX family)